MISDEDIRKAIDRIARSDDGKLLYLHCQKVLCATTSDDGALPRNEGRRRFASELMGLMAKGIEESGGRTDPIVTFALAGPRAISRAGGAGRRVTLTEPDADSDTKSHSGA